jgi:hypothetical protein
VVRQESKRSAAKFWVPGEHGIHLPVVTRPQTLPLHELPWGIFQRLCARLAQRSGEVEFAQEYGLPGQDQEGIDIYVRLRSSGRYSVWQCKRHRELKKTTISSTVGDFIAGEWLAKSDEFVPCFSVATEERGLADEIEAQKERLRSHNVALLPKGISQLSELLKGHSDLVDDFFGREWVREFCGEEAAQRLSHRILNREEVVRLRALLRRCYSQHFETVDPGLPSLTSAISGGPQPLPLAERFILPDVFEVRELSQTQESVADTQYLPASGSVPPSEQFPGPLPAPPRLPARVVTVVTEIRRPALEWITEGDLSTVLGDPGIGKSSLLRYLLLDLLSVDPRHESLAVKWGERLPVWVPFPMWTRMVAENESVCSLPDLLKTWLSKVSAPPDLLRLVEHALQDSRLLLLVDGLDEWSNETAARSTVALLEQFVGERNIPAIASSRPLGFERLGGLSSRWRRATLAGFTREQQHDYAYRWFLHQARVVGASGRSSEDHEAEKLADHEAGELIGDVQKDPRLARLAEVPLLLSGLIALSVQRARLPRSRFRAYEELTRLLLQEQPQRREKAAYARAQSTRLSQETRERALACLAFAVHQAPESDAIDKASARDTIRDFLATWLHKSQGEALELANQILVVSAESVGILVEKSPQQVGFPHRAFQEFLAARHLSNLPFEEQKNKVATLFGNPQWHDVLLCLCHLNTRAGEVDALLDVIEKINLPPELVPARQAFLAEVAFSDLHCSASIASKLAVETFREIETATWMPLRERLLEHALDGLFSDILRDETEQRVERWYPDRHQYRSQVYQAMANWPLESETVDALWEGLFNEEESNQRAAAEALAKYASSDPSVRQKLLLRLFIPADPVVSAYILHALCLGWPQEPRLPKLLEEGRKAASWPLKIAAIAHRVKRQEHDSDDREALLHFVTDYPHVASSWLEESIQALVKGWPKDAELKRMALKGLPSDWGKAGHMQASVAALVLMRGFSQDDEVASAFAALFEKGQFTRAFVPFSGHDWALLAESFAGHPLLRDAIDNWLEKQGNTLDYKACLVSRSLRAKDFLLRPNEKTGVIDQYQAHVLLQGWTTDDPDVAKALLDLANSPSGPSIADLLPKIFKDKKACRERLLDWLRTGHDYLAHKALTGLLSLGCDERDADVVNLAVEKFSGEVPTGVSGWGVSTVIENFAHDPRVREMALHQLQHRGGAVSAVARAYADDLEMRCKVARRTAPLQSNARAQIVDRLARLAPEHDLSHQFLSNYDEDVDGQVKTSAVIGYANSTKRRGQDQSALIKTLSEGLHAVGPDLHERRQAAFSGLLELQRLDIVEKADRSEQVLKNMNFGSFRHENYALASQMGRHWGQIRSAFGATFWDRAGYIPDGFLEQIISHSKERDNLEDVTAKMTKNADMSLSSPALRIFSRAWRGTDQLRGVCMKLVARSFPMSWIECGPAILAAEILSEQFANDPATRQELEILAGRTANPSVIVIALAGSWPDGPALKRLSDERVYKKLLLPARVHVRSRLDSPRQFAEWLSLGLTTLTGDLWEFLPSCVPPIISRLQRDVHAREELFRHLENNPSVTDKVNFPLFLRRTDTQLERLRTWCRKEFRQQISGEHVPESALEISSGRIRPVAHIALELLTS